MGEFSSDDKILVVTSSGYYELLSYDLTNHFPEDMILLEKYSSEQVITSVYFYGPKNQFYIKRFIPEIKSKKVYFIDQSKNSYLELVNSDDSFSLELSFIKPKNKVARNNEVIHPINFIDKKGVSAIGNQLSRHKIKSIVLIKSKEFNNDKNISEEQSRDTGKNQIKMNF